MSPTAGREDVDDLGAGQRAGDAGPSTVAAPTPFDALARELLAIRAMIAALGAMVDAALTTHGVVAAGGGATSDAFLKVSEARTRATRDLADVIRSAGAGSTGKVPRTFHDKQTTGAADATDAPPSREDTALHGDIVIPPIGTA